MSTNTLTAASTDEQTRAGLTACTPEELARIGALNTAYQAKFGFPFILAVRGPRGQGLRKDEILATFARRLENHPDFERAECLRNIHRIAEIRLGERFGVVPALGSRWDCVESSRNQRSSSRARRADGDLSHRGAPRMRRAARTLDAR
jgi:N-carbamoyl-L-amino-acid hydrolase